MLQDSKTTLGSLDPIPKGVTQGQIQGVVLRLKPPFCKNTCLLLV